MDEMVLEVQVWLNKTYNVGVVEDGNTGQATFKGLIKALQTELGIAADGTFGNGTLNACPNSIREGESNHNLVYILQGGFWCKGYNPGWFDGGFGPKTTRAVKEFQNDAGIAENGIVTPYILQGIMNTDGYKYKGEEGTNEYYKYQVQKNMNAIYGAQIGLTAPNGLWERKSHKNFIKCCQIEWSATPVDGVWGNGTMNKAPTLSKNTSGYTNSKRLLQWGLAINGFYPGDFSGAFGNDTYQAVYDFQNFMCLGADGIAGKNTWAALLSARGNTSRKATAFDTSTRLTLATAVAMKEAGYVDVGRYLTNTPGGTLDKKLTQEELEIIKSVGLNIFPIYQTYGGQASYFTRSQGRKDAREAIKAARTGRKESRKQVSDEMYISPRYLANIENKGQHPSLQIFFELMLRYNISVDQFLLDTPTQKDTKRRQLDALLDDMSDNGIRIVTATAKEISEVEKEDK